VRFRWLVVSCLSTTALFFSAAIARASDLQFWRFNPDENQLVFTTEAGVQPRAQLVSNPTRLIIDLPGIVLQSPVPVQEVNGRIRVVRISQLDAQTTRIVIELAEGYTIAPDQVHVRGISPRSWVVRLPEPGAIPPEAEPVASETPEVVPEENIEAPPAEEPAATSAPEPIPPPLTEQGPFLSEEAEVVTEVVTVEEPIPDLVEIQSVVLEEEGQQLRVVADGPITYSSGWDRSTADYQITIPNAHLSDQTTSPDLPEDSPFLNIRLEQQTPGTVALFVRPAARVNIRPAQPDRQSLILSLSREEGPEPLPPAWNPGDPAPEIALPTISDSRTLIVIDPGHGGRDPGAVGIGGLREIDVAFPISLRVAELLEQQGLQVVLTRSNDRTLDLGPRVQIANQANADFFVSIHANAISMSRPDVNGIETYYYSTSGYGLAEAIQNSMLQATGMRNRGVKRARFYVLRHTRMPAALVEVGFVTGAEDAPRLRDPQFHEIMSRAIARGILEYIQGVR
jgi:N-acetylmuramoyl-L-alanine amidase